MENNKCPVGRVQERAQILPDSTITKVKKVIKSATRGNCGKRQIRCLNDDYKVKSDKQVFEHINYF